MDVAALSVDPAQRPGSESERASGRPAALRNAGRFIGHYIASRPLQFLALFVTVLGASICALGVQYGMKMLIDAMSAPGRREDGVHAALAVFIVLVGAEALLWRVSGWLGSRTTIGAGIDIRLDLFRHLAGHSLRYFHEHLAGSLGHRLTSTAGAFGAIVNRMVWDVAPPLVAFVGALILFSALDAPMAALLAVFVCVVTLGLIGFGLKGRHRHRVYAERASQAGGELMDVLNNIVAVKVFSARERERARLADSFGQEAAAHVSSWMHNEKIRVVNDAALVLLAAGALTWAAHLWSVGRITAGDVVLVSTLTFRLLHGSRDLAMSLIDVSQQVSFIGETLRLVGRPHGLRDPRTPRAPAPARGALAFERVSFGYRRDAPVLRDLNLYVPPGQRVGLVGGSGAGKTTLINLIQRLHEVDSGKVSIDGQPVHELEQDALRRRIALVPQEVSLFHRSILDNIRFARPEASDDEVFAAARAAECEAFVRALPDGYDTRVGDRGAKLSGGQRQRLGIARAFLKDAPILILDEATSALDAESEAAIQSALAGLVEGRTVIAIAHRLSTLADMDRVLVLEDGRVIEDGSPRELAHRGGAFARLWRMQSDAHQLGAGRPPLKVVGR